MLRSITALGFELKVAEGNEPFDQNGPQHSEKSGLHFSSRTTVVMGEVGIDLRCRLRGMILAGSGRLSHSGLKEFDKPWA